MQNKESITALMSAFSRAYHAEHELDPIFEDSMARGLMTDEEYASIFGYISAGVDFFALELKNTFRTADDAVSYIVNTQLAPTPLCRAAYCENALKTAMLTGTRQYVILGAGLDTFAFREPEFAAKYDIFEVDHPKTKEDKLKRISRAGWKIPEKLRFAAVDFSADNLKEKLLSAGFDPKKKTFFSWLGVSYYLYRHDIEKMLDSISEIAADGSTLLFDYADAGLFFAEEKRVQNMTAMAKAGGEEMRASFDYPSMDKMLSDHGFLVYELLTPNEIQEQVIAPTGSDIKAFEHINYVQAVLKK